MAVQFRRKIKKFLPRWVIWIYYRLKTTKLRIITWVPRYNEDELMTAHLCDFKQDPKFRKAYDTAVKGGHAIWSPKIEWRAHVACFAGELGTKLEGDFVECGVARGLLSRTVIEYVGFNNFKYKKFYLIDTYEGLAERYLTSGEKSKEWAKYPSMLEFVKNAFAPYPNVKIVNGIIPDVLSSVIPNKVAYLSIDMNCVAPEIKAAEYFWPLMSNGAMIVLDDYGHAGHEEQRAAFNEFAKSKNVPILSLPTGQGLIVKV